MGHCFLVFLDLAGTKEPNIMLKLAAFCFGLFVITQAQALQEDIKEVKAGSARDKKRNCLSLLSIWTTIGLI